MENYRKRFAMADAPFDYECSTSPDVQRHQPIKPALE
jgi:hypothetical protein